MIEKVLLKIDAKLHDCLSIQPLAWKPAKNLAATECRDLKCICHLGQIVHDDISREDTGCRDRKLILQFSACESFQQNAPVQNVPMQKNV